MADLNCSYCGKRLESEIVVSNGSKLFCAPEHTPFEGNSCAWGYVEKHPEEFKKSYFFIRLKEKNE